MTLKNPRLLYGALNLGALALTAYLIADYRQYRQERDESIQLGEQAGIRVAEALDAQLNAISERAGGFAAEAATIDKETQLLQSIKNESRRFPLVLGVTVAFEPGGFLGRKRYAPFFNKRRSEFQFVEESYDYTDPALAIAKWYTDVVTARQSKWSAPYYAEAAKTMVVDYGAPLINSPGDVIGVVDYAIALSDFSQIVDSLSVGEAGDGFTYEPGGAIISHPNTDYLLDNTEQLRMSTGNDSAEDRRTLAALVCYASSTSGSSICCSSNPPISSSKASPIFRGIVTRLPSTLMAVINLSLTPMTAPRYRHLKPPFRVSQMASIPWPCSTFICLSCWMVFRSDPWNHASRSG